MAESWDDSALVAAFNAAIEKYQDRHNPKKKQPVEQTEQQLDGSMDQVDEVDNAGEESSQAADFAYWPGMYPYPPLQQTPPIAPTPYPGYHPYPFVLCPAPFLPFPGQAVPEAKSHDPSFETLKQAVLQAISQLPDKHLSFEDSTEVLVAWFNAGFRTASHLYKKQC